MEQVKLNIYYNGIDYSSDIKEICEDDKEELIIYSEKASAGEMESINIVSGNNIYFFSSEILKQSVISIIKI